MDKKEQKLANDKPEILILGGGLTGLSAGYCLTKAGRKVKVLERDATIGGLAKTVIHGEFRFDLGGHRFFTKDKDINDFVQDLMDGEFLTVSRKSKILLKKRYFDYPLKPLNVISGLGLSTSLKIIHEYAFEQVKKRFKVPRMVSLEDWVISHFGRTLYNIYFKAYSEKVWGIDCSRMSMEWVAKRIEGLTLGTAISNAFFRFNGSHIATLAGQFIYPSKGIGKISERLQEEIQKRNPVLFNMKIERLCHDDFRIKTVKVQNGSHTLSFQGEAFISSIPMTDLVLMLDPKPADDVLRAAANLRYRDMVLVAVMLNREKITDQTWIYIPEKEIPFNRIHEPKNWSSDMAPPDKTLIVVEYCCFEDDETWRTSDESIARMTSENLIKLGFIRGTGEVLDHVVIKIPKAYPILEIGYHRHYHKILEYLSRFKNLQIIGRGGLFKYYNMDHAIKSGIEAADNMINGSTHK